MSMQPVSHLPRSQEESLQSLYCSPFPESGLEIDAPSVLGGGTTHFTFEDDFINCLDIPIQRDMDIIVTSRDCELAELPPWQAMPDCQWGNQYSAGDMTSSLQDTSCLNSLWGMCLNNVRNEVSYPDCARDACMQSCKLDSPTPFSGITACSQASDGNFFSQHSPLNSEATSQVTKPHLSLHQQDGVIAYHQTSSLATNSEHILTPSPNSTAAWPRSSTWHTLAAVDNTVLFHPSPCFTSEASLHKAAPSPQSLEVNLEATAGLAPSLLKLETSISQAASNLAGKARPFQVNLVVADHDKNGPSQTSPIWCHTQTNEHTKREDKRVFDSSTLKKSTSSTRESTQVVQFLVECSTSVIDDGYVWRKYGQKNIKNKVHPRGYFRCAQDECSVKKQTETSSEKPGFVLITYFGRHNH